MLMEEVKPEITEKVEFQYGDQKLILETFGNFGLSDFWCSDQSKRLFKKTDR